MRISGTVIALVATIAVVGGTKTYWRTINVFSGPDAIHFEIQRSGDGKAWTTRQSGDERRIK